MRNVVIKSQSRRKFLQTMPVAAAAGLTLTDASLVAAYAAGQSGESGALTFQVFSAQEIQGDIKVLDANPGNKSLIDWKTCVAMLTVEKEKSAKEFEWHEGRDHVFQILDGSTVYELGGMPKNGRNIRPGEWLAPESAGAKTITLNKGDILVIPRGTPHKRSTAGSVTLLLISPQGS
jgi:mannose-6-phosphate isomerase-like protein (cupin superfamily)